MPFLIAIFEEKLLFISVSNNIAFPFKGLEAPLRNLKTQADAEEEYPEEFQAFLDTYEPLRKARGELRIANLRQ